MFWSVYQTRVLTLCHLSSAHNPAPTHLPQTQQQVVSSQLLTIKVIPTFLPDLGAQRQCLVLDPFAIPLPFCSCFVPIGLCALSLWA